MHIQGQRDAVLRAKAHINRLYTRIKDGHNITQSDLIPESSDINQGFASSMHIGAKPIRLLNQAQASLIHSIAHATIHFAIGPAGTGKTFLSIAAALMHFTQGHVKRILLARPAVDAGEKLGFLPGDMHEKVNPYLRPFYDELHRLIGPEKTQAYLEQKKIEIAPIAFMRGRTLSDAFIIVDEAQNTTVEQMKMLLTRIGHRSKMVVAGDILQNDLDKKQSSGLEFATQALQGIPEITFNYFHTKDNVRHSLITDILHAFEKYTT